MNQALDFVRQFHYGAEIQHLGDHAFHHGTDGVQVVDAFPGVRAQLLDAQRESFLVRVDVQNNGVDFVTLVEHLGRVLDLAGPRNVLQVHQAVDALLDAHEDPETGDRPHGALHLGAHGVLFLQQVPRVDFSLLEPQGDALVAGIHLQHNGFHFVARVEQLGRMFDLFRPGHLRHVDESLHARFQFDECAVVRQGHHATADPVVHGVALVRPQPRVLGALLHSQ